MEETSRSCRTPVSPGILGKVSHEGGFWETRSLEWLTKEIGEQSAMLVGFLGALKGANHIHHLNYGIFLLVAVGAFPCINGSC